MVSIGLKDFQIRGGFKDPGLRESFSKNGFFVFKNHGIDQALVHQTYRWASDFFNQKQAQKNKYACQFGLRGYTAFHPEEKEAGDLFVPEFKDSWNMGRPGDKKNLWPESTLPYRAELEEVYLQLETIAMVLLESLGKEFPALQKTFDQMTLDSILRVLSYPSQQLDQVICRVPPHEDLSLFTLLGFPSHSGLEGLDDSGAWKLLPVEDDEIIVMSGRMLEYLTNGLFKPRLHRVVTGKSIEPRFSIPYFVLPSADSVVYRMKGTSDEVEKKGIPAKVYLDKALKQLPDY